MHSSQITPSNLKQTVAIFASVGLCVQTPGNPFSEDSHHRAFLMTQLFVSSQPGTALQFLAFDARSAGLRVQRAAETRALTQARLTQK